jgi:hypothetical protein
MKLTNDEMLKQTIQGCLNTNNPKLLKVLYYNMREQGISNTYFNQLCLYLFRKQGYNVIELTDKTIDMTKEKLEFDYDDDEYSKIETLSPKDVDALKHQDTNKESKISVDKYFFENLLVRDLPLNIKSKIFFDIYQNPFKKSILKNLRIEKSKLTIEQIINDDFDDNDYLINKLTLKALKLNHIKQLNKLMKLETSCINNAIVIKANDKLMKYLITNIDSINVSFGTKYKFQKNSKMQNNLVCFMVIQSVYSKWSGLSFKVHERNEKGTKSYITVSNDIIDYLKCIEMKATIRNIMDSDDED